jgi:hypothetical protein
MASKLFISIMLSFVLATFPFVGSVGASSEMWSRTYGGGGYESARSVVATSDGGYAIAGIRDYGGTEDNRLVDCWLVKTDEFGNMEWNQIHAGGAQTDEPRSLVVMSDGGYAIGGYTDSFGAGDNDFWLVKTNEYGEVKWNRTYGGTEEDRASSLVATSDGGCAMAGFTRSFGAGENDFWLVKIDASGNVEWNQTYGGTDYDSASSLVVTSDGGYAIAGRTSSFGSGIQDCWLIKTDNYGNMEWDQTYGGLEDDSASSLVATSDGGYAIAGATNVFGDGNFWLIKTDRHGNVEWNQTYTEPNSVWTWSLISTSDGGYAILGNTVSSGAGSSDFWLVKTDAMGNTEWNRTYGGTEADYPYSLVEASDGGYALVGYTFSFGAGNGDFWLIKTDEYGIVPEFPSCIVLTFLFAATSIIILYKNRLPKNPATNRNHSY